MTHRKSRYDWMVTPLFERISNRLPLPYPIAWLVISEVLFLFYFLVLLLFEGIDIQHIGADAILPILLTLISTGVILFSKSMENFTDSIKTFIDWPEEKIISWYSKLIQNTFSAKQMIKYAIPLSIISVFVSLGFKDFDSTQAKFAYSSFMFLIGFAGGCMLHSMIGIGRIVSALGDIEKLKVSIYQHPTTSIKAAGKLLFGISIFAAITYATALIYVCIEYRERLILGGALTRDFCIIFILVAFGLFVIGYFIFPQIKVHDLMAKYKYKKIRQFSKHLDSALDKVMNEPSRSNMEQVKELFEIQKELNRMSEWPFDTKFALTLISVVIIPILIVVITVLAK